MNKGSRVLVVNGEFTGVEGILESVGQRRGFIDFTLDNEIYADIKVNQLNPPIKVKYNDIVEVEIINEDE